MPHSQYERLLLAGFNDPLGLSLQVEFEQLATCEVTRAPSIRVASANLRVTEFNLVVVDHQIDGGDGVLLGSLLRKRSSTSLAFLLTAEPKWMMVDIATKNGFAAVINRSLSPSLLVEKILSWQPETSTSVRDKLSSREVEIMRDLSLGSTTYEIAMKRHISEATVKSHLTSIYRKLEVRNRIEAVTAFQRVD